MLPVTRFLAAALVALPVLPAPGAAGAQAGDSLPFAVGERLTYQVRVARTGSTGEAVMAVNGPVDVRGVSTDVLSFDVSARLGLMPVSDRSKSWINPRRMSALRFWKHESRPLSHSDQSVEIDGAARRWTDADGESGATLSDAPLDELSFIYYLRTLALAPGSTLEVNRHFDPARNPTDIRVLGADTVTVGSVRIPATVLEMRVRDNQSFGGSGAIRLTLSDDRCHVPLKMESSMPVVGRVVLTLTSFDGLAASCTDAMRGHDTLVNAP
jgi:hypothetical protein